MWIRCSSTAAISKLSKLIPRRTNVNVIPRTQKQKEYLHMLENEQVSIVVAHGSAGSGKTKIAIGSAVKYLVSGKTDKIIITRPIVPTGNDIGFLPGKVQHKMKPWLMPIYDSLGAYFDSEVIEKLVNSDVIEIAPMTYMRGRTFENAWVVCDEAQNCTPDQLLMLMTRIGTGSKMIITGDPIQHDDTGENGLEDLIYKLEQNPHSSIGVIEFEPDDSVRHPIIPYILSLYTSR
jgi:phosphate starvation-inducible PhoH-like protein